jgi:hypothetical protein
VLGVGDGVTDRVLQEDLIVAVARWSRSVSATKTWDGGQK